MDERFVTTITAGYATQDPALFLGCAMLDGEVAPAARVQLPLAMSNRHGLIAGATGTGKTTTLKVLAAELSKAGVPIFISDIKGDVTGIAAPNDPANKGVVERSAQLQITFTPAGHPVEFFSLSGKLGAQVRATVHSFGPVLLGKVLDLNETQTSILSLIFKYCDDNQLPLLDLKDLQATLKYLSSDDGQKALADYGGMAASSVGVLLRSIITFEQSGADVFFGEPEFDVNDLLRTTPQGEGVISVLELSDVMDKPKLFSTFMLWLLAQLYHQLPEVGDLPKPKLAFFFDEAHLLFHDASDALMEQIEQTVRLIRSKGVGVYFSTQTPTDVPASVLSQLGNRVQHALRAFTPEDADNLRKTARTFPISEFYDVEKVITSLGIGEALVTLLSPKGVPTPLAATRLAPPDCLFGALDPATFAQKVASGSLVAKYGTPLDRASAYEILTAKIQAAQDAAAAAQAQEPMAGGDGSAASAREAAAAARQAAREQARIDREQARADRQATRDAAAAERARERMMGDAIRTGGRILTSRTGQSIVRGVFGVLFGKR